MGYDALGNMTSKVNVSEDRHQTLLYDFYNRLLVVREGVGENKKNVGRYWYDEQGFRVRKKSKQTVYGTENGERVSAIRWYELDYHNQYFAIERQKDEAGRVIPDTEYSINNIYLNGVRIAAMEESGAARYFLTDQVDSVKVVADDFGNAVSRIEYMPYGETWFTESSPGEAVTPKYNSQELDKESDLYYFNARHYDPELARFVSADTVIPEEDFSQSWNRYMYTRGNPITYKDPSGHIWGAVVGRAIAAVASGAKAACSRFPQTCNRLTNAITKQADKAGKFLKDKGNQLKEVGKQAVKKGKELYKSGKKLAQKVADKVSTKTTEAAVKTQDKIGAGIDKTKQVGKLVGNQAKIEAAKVGTGQGITGKISDVAESFVSKDQPDIKRPLTATKPIIEGVQNTINKLSKDD